MGVTPEIIKAPSRIEAEDWFEGRFLHRVLKFLQAAEANPFLIMDRVLSCSNLELATLSGNLELARDIGLELGKIVDPVAEQVDPAEPVRRFADGELRIQYRNPLRDKHVVIIQPFSPAFGPEDAGINAQVVELLLAIGAAKRGSAAEITVVTPYFAYSRSDRKDLPRVTIASSDLLKAYQAVGANRFVTVDIHQEAIAGSAEIFDNVYSSEIFIPSLIKMIRARKAYFVSPDAGAVRTNLAYSKRVLGHEEIGVITKSRNAGSSQSNSLYYSGPNLNGSIVIMVDDMLCSGGTAVSGAEMLASQGVLLDQSGNPEIYFIAPHGQFLGNALDRIRESYFKQVWTTNSIRQRPEVFDRSITGDKVVVYNIAPFLAEKIVAVHTGKTMGLD